MRRNKADSTRSCRRQISECITSLKTAAVKLLLLRRGSIDIEFYYHCQSCASSHALSCRLAMISKGLRRSCLVFFIRRQCPLVNETSHSGREIYPLTNRHKLCAVVVKLLRVCWQMIVYRSRCRKPERITIPSHNNAAFRFHPQVPSTCPIHVPRCSRQCTLHRPGCHSLDTSKRISMLTAASHLPLLVRTRKQPPCRKARAGRQEALYPYPTAAAKKTILKCSEVP